jgi:hypothetical protein
LESPYWPFQRRFGFGGATRFVCATAAATRAPALVTAVDRASKLRKMKPTHDPTVDVPRIVLSTAPIEEHDAEKPGIIPDCDTDGSAVGVELLDASRRSDTPRLVEFAAAG